MNDASEVGSKKGQESKEEKFRRLAEARVNNALDKIRIIGNLASPQYAYAPEQVEKIMASLQSAVAEVQEKFQATIERKRKKFQL